MMDCALSEYHRLSRKVHVVALENHPNIKLSVAFQEVHRDVLYCKHCSQHNLLAEEVRCPVEESDLAFSSRGRFTPAQ